jgi:hypothetical protein
MPGKQLSGSQSSLKRNNHNLETQAIAQKINIKKALQGLESFQIISKGFLSLIMPVDAAMPDGIT